MKKADKRRKWRQIQNRILGILLVLSICAASLNLPMVSASAAVLREDQKAKTDPGTAVEETSPEEPGNPQEKDNRDVNDGEKADEKTEEDAGIIEAPPQESESTLPEEEIPAAGDLAEEAGEPDEDLDASSVRGGVKMLVSSSAK